MLYLRVPFRWITHTIHKAKSPKKTREPSKMTHLSMQTLSTGHESSLPHPRSPSGACTQPAYILLRLNSSWGPEKRADFSYHILFPEVVHTHSLCFDDKTAKQKTNYVVFRQPPSAVCSKSELNPKGATMGGSSFLQNLPRNMLESVSNLSLFDTPPNGAILVP